MKHVLLLIAGSAMLQPSLATAQTSAPAAPMPSERRLSPEQIETILEEAATKNRAADRVRMPDVELEAPKPRVHGEVGVTIGTGGYREVYGSAIYPMGEDGIAAISLDMIDFGHRRSRYRR